MNTETMVDDLHNLANKLAQMWGQHPDVALIRHAASTLEAAKEAPKDTTKKVGKKESKQ